MTKSRPAITAWENDRTIVRFPDAKHKGINNQGNTLVGPQLQWRGLPVGTVQREGGKG